MEVRSDIGIVIICAASTQTLQGPNVGSRRINAANACDKTTHHDFFLASLNAIRSLKREVTSKSSSPVRRHRRHFSVQRLGVEVSMRGASACDESTHLNFFPASLNAIRSWKHEVTSRFVITRAASTRTLQGTNVESRGIIGDCV